MADTAPWEIHQDLGEDRLVALAGLIMIGRNNALGRFDGEIGDNPWTLGCCAYAFAKHEIIKASMSDKYPWLKLVDDGAQFTFSVGSVPVRFYRGIPEDPHPRTLRQAFPELKQLELALDGGRDLRDRIFRLAVETGFEGEVTRIAFVAMRGMSVDCCWSIPLSATPAVLYAVREERDEGVALEAPAVRVPRPDEGIAKGGGRAS